MADIETPQDILNWFSDTGNGRSKQGFHVDLLTRLVQHGSYEHPGDLWNAIYDHDFCHDFRANAWFTRTGVVYTCGWAKHEMLLRYMGLTISEVEEAGWVRVSGMTAPTSIQGRYRPSPGQISVMRRNGVKVDLRDPNRPWLQKPLPEDAPVITRFEKSG